MNSELKYIIKPGALLLTLIVMFILVITLGYKQISLLYLSTGEIKENERLLSLKLDILQTVDEVLADDISFIDIALPSRGSVLYGISQVKKLALTKNVLVSNLKTSAQALEENGISKIPITFSVEGSEGDIYSFLSTFYSALPLMNLEKVKIDKTEGVAIAAVTVSVYSAALPEKIPALAEGVDGFTNEDIQMLNRLSDFTRPDFFDPRPSEGSTRDDPFN